MNFLTAVVFLVFLFNYNNARLINYHYGKDGNKELLKSIWRMTKPDNILDQHNIEHDTNRRDLRSIDQVLTIFKRTQSPLIPYESISVMSDLKQFFDSINTNVKELKNNQKLNYKIQRKDDFYYPGNYFRGRNPSDNIRNFIRHDDGESLRGTNSHDPGILWTGLGKKKRR
ncbi:uncharacterized protein LOC126834781 isoform X2 [Adelges cooleyi]|uniref:uncharacterized protein LOC126834781 isoform X2 n=1 Tax=Adelges cooleyi TaxID=133065 RepID=UPI0021807DDE|nr:uncharacterized protein LOC126834781 isoform X2 [Adelges cooleyi]